MTEITVEGAQYFRPGEKVWATGTNETMVITGMRKGRTREVWKYPVAWRWKMRWRLVPWRVACAWQFAGETETVTERPHRKAVRVVDTEQFMTIRRGT